MQRRLVLIVALAVLRLGSAVAATEPKHVVLVVWDGMRPDFVTEERTPTLWKLAREGVTFRNHHSTIPRPRT